MPNAAGIGTDLSAGALDVARRNAARLGLAERAQFLVSDFAAGLAGPFDLVVSNPPYIATGEIAALAREVRDHDPRLALDGGADGLAAYRAIAADAPRLIPAGISWSKSAPGSSATSSSCSPKKALQSRPSGTTFRVSRGRSRRAAHRWHYGAAGPGQRPKNRLECRKRPTRVGFTESNPDWVTHCHRGPEHGSARRQSKQGETGNFPLEERHFATNGYRELSPVERWSGMGPQGA